MLNLPCSSSSAYLYKKKTKVGKAGARGKEEPHLDASCAVAACWYLFTIDIRAGGFSLPLGTYLHWRSLCKLPAAAVVLAQLQGWKWEFKPAAGVFSSVCSTLCIISGLGGKESCARENVWRFNSSADINGQYSIDLSGMTLAFASSGVSVVRRETKEKQL